MKTTTPVTVNLDLIYKRCKDMATQHPSYASEADGRTQARARRLFAHLCNASRTGRLTNNAIAKACGAHHTTIIAILRDDLGDGYEKDMLVLLEKEFIRDGKLVTGGKR